MLHRFFLRVEAPGRSGPANHKNLSLVLLILSPMTKLGPKPRPPDQRFWENVDASGDCWEWTGSKWSKGYGRFWTGTGRVGAHRWCYEHLVAQVPNGKTLDHLCRNPSCVNPDHLEVVTYRVNYLRGVHRNAVTYKTGVCPRGHVVSGRCEICIQQSNFAQSKVGGYHCKLYCKRGHPMFGPDADIYLRPDGARVCRICKRIRERPV